MSNNPDIEEVLDDVVRGNIDRHQAEQLLRQKSIVDFDGEIDLHRSAIIALQQFTTLTQVLGVHRDFIATSVIKKQGRLVRFRPLKWIVRVAVVFVVAIAGWFAFQYATNNSTTIYADIFQPYVVNTDRSNADSMISNSMLQQFKDMNFPEVIKTFQALPVSGNREKFLAAYAWHETGNYQQAINVLQQLLQYNEQQSSRLYNDEAEFYTGLSYLKINDVKAALPWFERIQNDPTHTFHERVSKWTITRLKWLI